MVLFKTAMLARLWGVGGSLAEVEGVLLTTWS